MRPHRALAVVVTVAFVVAGCGGSSGIPSATSRVPTGSAQARATPTATAMPAPLSTPPPTPTSPLTGTPQPTGPLYAVGDDSKHQIEVPAGLTGIVAISAGGYHSLALRRDGTVFAWGYDEQGEIDVPARLSGVRAISAGWFHSLELAN